MTTYKEKLARARKATRSVPICLAGDLVAEFQRLERQLAEATAVKEASYSLEDTSDLTGIAERIEALRAEMREQTEDFVVQALPGEEYRALKAEHPARQDDDGNTHDQDKLYDVNVDSVAAPLLRACLVSPELDDEDWAATMTALTEGQYSDLVNAAFNVNEGRVVIPFSRAASAILQGNSPE